MRRRRSPTPRRASSKRSSILTEDSAASGLTLAQAKKLTNGEMTVRSVLRPPDLSIAPLPDVTLRPGDQLVVRDTSERLMEFARVLGAKLFSGDVAVDAAHPLTARISRPPNSS